MSENDLKSYIQNLDLDNIKILLLSGNLNFGSSNLTGDNDPIILLIKSTLNKSKFMLAGVILDFLLSNGFKSNVKDSEGNTPLHYAFNNKNIKCIEILLNNNANLNAVNKNGITPIMLGLDIKTTNIKPFVTATNFLEKDFSDLKIYKG